MQDFTQARAMLDRVASDTGPFDYRDADTCIFGIARRQMCRRSVLRRMLALPAHYPTYMEIGARVGLTSPQSTHLFGFLDPRNPQDKTEVLRLAHDAISNWEKIEAMREAGQAIRTAKHAFTYAILDDITDDASV